jgi:hypothetical protein
LNSHSFHFSASLKDIKAFLPQSPKPWNVAVTALNSRAKPAKTTSNTPTLEPFANFIVVLLSKLCVIVIITTVVTLLTLSEAISESQSRQTCGFRIRRPVGGPMSPVKKPGSLTLQDPAKNKRPQYVSPKMTHNVRSFGKKLAPAGKRPKRDRKKADAATTYWRKPFNIK